ncbi:hypothetical protein YC2023_084993 [Brassica napus]
MGRTHVQQGWEVHTGHYSTKRRATHSCHFVTVHVSLYSIYYTVMIVLCRYSLFRIARSITPNIIMFLPRNIDLEQLEELARLSSPPLTLEIEENYVQGKIKAIKAYFSCSAKKNLTFHLSESPTELESDLRQVLKIVQNSETTIKKLVLDLEASFDRKMDKLTKEIKEIKTLISRFNTRW